MAYISLEYIDYNNVLTEEDIINERYYTIKIISGFVIVLGLYKLINLFTF